MAKTPYKLSDNVEDSFDFELAGHIYRLRYPTLEELENVQKELKDIDQNANIMAGLEWMRDFVTGVEKDTPDLMEVLRKQNIRVIIEFGEMWKTEFGVK